MDTVSRKRIDILADAPLVPRIVAALHGAGIHGHTVLPALSGSGRGGRWNEDLVTDAESKRLVMAVASDARASQFIDAVGPLLDAHGMLLTISDVQVVRADRF